ncbi:MAG: non-ribosomal peptide synthetase, partial [Planctomycetota bacterium]
RYVIFGGEELKTADLKSWYERHDDRHPQLVNMYGITETTVHVTYRPLSAADVKNDTGRGIGRPLPDLKVYLLDENMEPVPVGVPGEIYVGGAGIAREYLGRPELTAERFIPDTFSRKGGARLYKSGDLGRYSSDGIIEFLGRIDQQVKMRGYRIEPGEIETILVQHDGVKDAIVMAREEKDGDRRLVGYVQVNGKSEASVKGLRDWVKKKLPEYMVPSAFVFMDSFPLTPNGKLDRQALPKPFDSKTDHGKSITFPQTSLERKLINIWQEILHHDDIGIHDDFFDMGGHSLLAMKLIAWVRRDLQVELSIRNVFEFPTIADLVKIIGGEKEKRD